MISAVIDDPSQLHVGVQNSSGEDYSGYSCLQIWSVLMTCSFAHVCMIGDALVTPAVSIRYAEPMMDERQRRHAALETALREVINQILQHVNEKKDHIPPVLHPDVVVSFPFEIAIPRYIITTSRFIFVRIYTNRSMSL